MRIVHGRVADANQTHVTVVGQQTTARNEVAVARPQDRVEHRLEKEEVAHPLGHDDVNALEWQPHVLHATLQQRDLLLQSVLSAIE